MAKRSGGNYAASWFIIGFLTGIAATLAVVVFVWRARDREAAAVPPAPPAAVQPAHRAELKARRSPMIPASSLPTPDEQVQEDAAAAGMTSRSHSRPPQ